MRDRGTFVVKFNSLYKKYEYENMPVHWTSNTDIAHAWRTFNLFDLELEAMHRVKELNLKLAESLMKEANS